MSYDRTNIVNKRSAENARLITETVDLRRYRSLQALENSTKISKQESDFITSQLEHQRIKPENTGSFTRVEFTDRQREAIDELIKKHGGAL